MLFHIVGGLGHVLRMVPHPLDIVDAVEQVVHHHLLALVQGQVIDLDQIIGQPLLQLIDGLLHLIDLFGAFTVRIGQGIHGPPHILQGDPAHVDHLCGSYLDRKGRGLKDTLIQMAVDLLFFSFSHMDRLALLALLHKKSGQPDQLVGEGIEQDRVGHVKDRVEHGDLHRVDRA